VSGASGYQVLDNQVMAFREPSSASFSPDGAQVAATEGTNLYLITKDGSRGFIQLEEDATRRPVEGIVWSPSGRYLAFVADLKQNCGPCRRVAFLIPSLDHKPETVLLEPPEGMAIGLPRWTQDGRLLVTIYKDDPGGGQTYIYDTSGRGQPASGAYILSSSLEGQKWWPWLPGRNWKVGQGRPDSYYGDE
jgi:Tol biopolymer transport system component